jgi:hypothetical protein
LQEFFTYNNIMEENIQTILTLFMEKPYLIKMGAGKLA